MALAREFNADVWVVQCQLDEDEAQRRLERREDEGSSPSDGRWELYHHQLGQWDPVAEVPEDRRLILDTSGSPQEVIASLLGGLYAGILRARA